MEFVEIHEILHAHIAHPLVTDKFISATLEPAALPHSSRSLTTNQEAATPTWKTLTVMLAPAAVVEWEVVLSVLLVLLVDKRGVA